MKFNENFVVHKCFDCILIDAEDRLESTNDEEDYHYTINADDGVCTCSQ